MVKIIRKKSLNSTVTLMEVSAPLEAAKAEPGQFVILRASENGERIPLTIADFNREKGTVTIIFQIVGAATWQLNRLGEGDMIQDFVGPLGKATDCKAAKVAIVGGGVGSAIAYPVVKKFHQQGAEVHAITGFRTRDLVILEEEFKVVSDTFFLMTDDGSYGRHGLVTEALQLLIDKGERYDEVIAIGPLVMMKFVATVTKPYGIKTTVSMNPIMIDGTGMCGGCRLSVGGKTKFACVDGPDFDGHEVDFNEAIARSAIYRPFEARAYEACQKSSKVSCHLLKADKEVS
ncbi:MAG: sulfide/dihydroorotate dehydrogenase-like FAD/NAD-binding protein [Treponema sp.]|jgi:ferredoxin--NADP+ reductase|nr:sulfide/dihydroorotate dehydrogenase-like FAD/NAD-binding protein [Treponema sp.]